MANVMRLTTPLMRQTVGFDRFNDLFETLLSEAPEGFDSYPPYNIEKVADDNYKIVMAVAGFNMEDLNIMVQDGELTISGKIEDKNKLEKKVEVLHRGIENRAFERKFQLADYIQVTEADLKDGLLTISLYREIPEEKKPRMIEIKGETKLIGNKKKN